MPAEEFYQVHTTNLNRPPNVSTLTPRKPTNAPPPGRPNPRRSPGPIYLPANIYKLLSDVAIKELKKHNATTRSTPPPKRAVNPHDTDPHPSIPPLTLPQVIQPLQIPLQTLIWTTLSLVKPSPLMTPPLSTSWIPIPPLTLSIKPTSMMCLNILPPIMGLLLIGEANGGLAGSDVRILERTGRTVSVTDIGNHELPCIDPPYQSWQSDSHHA